MLLPLTDLRLTRRQALEALGCASALALGGCATGGQEGPAAEPGPVDELDVTAEPEPAPRPAAERFLSSMTLEQKVAQMLFVTPEQLTGVDCATEAGPLTKEALVKLPVGGVAYFGGNLAGDQQLRDLLSGTVELSRNAGAGIPIFTGVDEEGGPLVARVANSGLFDVERFPNMWWIGESGDVDRAAHVGTVIGSYLRDIGFSVDFAPVADVLTNPDNPVIGHRSFSGDPDVCAQMVSAELEAMLQAGTLPCAKHFPGHGDTQGDSHTGAVTSWRSVDELRACEYVPFEAAVEAGCPFIMVGHVQTPNAAGDGLPASLSRVMITEELRERLGFKGVVISDSLSMGAISRNFEPEDAAVRFVAAGGDVLLMPTNPWAAHQGIIDAVYSGSLTEGRIDESVLRIIAAKQAAGLVEA